MPRSTVGKYLIRRLEEAGLKHVFGIPGDYVLGFYDLLLESKLEVVGTCTEIGAGFAADAYARVNGLGAMCVTYCVGGLNALNAVAGAYAEKSPLIVISGAPGLGERKHSSLLHHAVRDYRTQLQIFEKVTIAAEALEDPNMIPRQIDEGIELCQRYKRPIYFEIPRDMVEVPCKSAGPLVRGSIRSDKHALQEAVAEAAAMLKAARRPVILGGVEIHRFGLQNQLTRLVEDSGMPVAATLLGKSIISEMHPQYLGVYEGGMGEDKVRRAVESADCLLILGAFMTDVNLGIYTARLDESRAINATSEQITIKHHHYEDIQLGDFIPELTRALGTDPQGRLPARKAGVRAPAKAKPFKVQAQKPCTVRRFFERINEFIDEGYMVICDIGDSLFGAAELTIHRKTEFISPAFYTSMGFAVPAAIGTQINRKNLRPLVFVGDGAFQMTGMELSSIARNGMNPIIFVLNNKGYTTERFIREGPYNDIHDWAYHLVPQILQKGWGCEVRTEGELEEALSTARTNINSFSLINIHLDKLDHSRALKRLGGRLGRKTKIKKEP